MAAPVSGTSGKYTISLQITTDDGRCDLDFHHTCSSSEMAFIARQFVSVVANGGVMVGAQQPFGPQPMVGATQKEKRIGKKVTAEAFERPSVVFSRATRTAPKMDTEIRGQAPRTADGNVHAAIFGEDEDDYGAAAADMQLGNFTPSAYDYASLRH